MVGISNLVTCGNWRNTIRHYSEIERFLARCLGGRVPAERAGS